MVKQAPSMKLNHMSFPTADVPATSTFFERYLGFTIAQKFEPNFYILKRPGFDVVIERTSAEAPTPNILAQSGAPRAFAESVGGDAQWPKAFHLGFELPTADDVRSLREQLQADGFEPETGIFNPERGSRFFCRASGGVMIEFTTRADAAEQFRGTFDD